MASSPQAGAALVAALVGAGYVPDSADAAAASEDLTLLRHAGRLSVRLQAPLSSPIPALKGQP